jgi:hypothetical protein
MQGSQSLDPYPPQFFPNFITCWIVTAASKLHWNTQLSTCVSMAREDGICIIIPKDDIVFSLSPETLCNLKHDVISDIVNPQFDKPLSKWYSLFQQLAIKQPQDRYSLQGILKFPMNTHVCRMHETNMIAAVHILLDIWGQLLSDPSPHVRVDTSPLRALPPDVTRITCRQFTKENGTQKSWYFIHLPSFFLLKFCINFTYIPHRADALPTLLYFTLSRSDSLVKNKTHLLVTTIHTKNM